MEKPLVFGIALLSLIACNSNTEKKQSSSNQISASSKLTNQKDSIDKVKLKANSDSIDNAKRIASFEQKKQLAKLSPQIFIKEDKMEDIKFYFDKTSPQHLNYNGLFCYIGKGTGKDSTLRPVLHLRIQYTGSDWLFIRNYLIRTDNNKYTVTPDEVKTDNDSRIFEWCDISNLTDEQQKMLMDIATSKEVTLRCNGKQYYDDRQITQNEKNALKNVLQLYSLL